MPQFILPDALQNHSSLGTKIEFLSYDTQINGFHEKKVPCSRLPRTSTSSTPRHMLKEGNNCDYQRGIG